MDLYPDRTDTTTWHYGLIARWWGEFNDTWEIDDIDYFHRAITAQGGPVLDVGCGTGRLTIPLSIAGLEIEGTDVSGDMLDWARKRSKSNNLNIKFHEQATQELTLPRKYQTIIMCGAFGLGGNRATDLEGLKRIHAHLRPGGTFIMDHYPTNGEDLASRFTTAEQSWPDSGDRKRAVDGDDIELKTRSLDFDAKTGSETREIMALLYRNNQEIQRQIFTLKIGHYSVDDVESMLRTAGFDELQATVGLTDLPPKGKERRIVLRGVA
jgi:ubiquinone/menaquinone biosynthesis C-methylase UbiE